MQNAGDSEAGEAWQGAPIPQLLRRPLLQEPGQSQATTAGHDRPALRQKFAAVDDVVLLKAVNYFRPWAAAVGTSNGIMKVFDEIAIHCRLYLAFGLKKPGPAMRTRFTSLINQFEADQCQSMRKSRTVEEYEEREVLLQNILNQMDDWKEKEAEEKEQKTAKQRGIESSGALLRRLAMGEIDEYNEEEVEDSLDAGPEPHACSSTVVPMTVATASPITSGDTSRNVGLNDTTPSTTPKKRSGSKSSGRKKKVTKREQLGVVTNALSGALMGAGEEDKMKYEYKTKRLEFEREQEEKKRQHQQKEAEKCRDHELQLEERRLKADEEREKRMHEFLLKILSQQKKKELTGLHDF